VKKVYNPKRRFIVDENEVDESKAELMKSLSSEYTKGFNDALYDRGYQPTSLEYVAGYKKGVWVREIGPGVTH